MKFFQVTAILNSQSKRIETNVKEDSARFTQNILNRNQKNEKGELFIPQNPVDDLNLSSDYINQRKHKNDKKNNNQKQIVEDSICLEDRFKIYLIQYFLTKILGGGLKLYLPDMKWFQGEGNCQFYSKSGLCDYNEKKNIVNDILSEKLEFNSNQCLVFNLLVQERVKKFNVGIYLNRNQKNSKFNLISMNEQFTLDVDSFNGLDNIIDTDLIFYLDNYSNIYKNTYNDFNFYQIESNLDFKYLDQNEDIYDGLRIWEKSSNNEPVLFAFGIKNFGIVFAKHIIEKNISNNSNDEMLIKNKQFNTGSNGIISPAIKSLDIKLK